MKKIPIVLLTVSYKSNWPKRFEAAGIDPANVTIWNFSRDNKEAFLDMIPKKRPGGPEPLIVLLDGDLQPLFLEEYHDDLMTVLHRFDIAHHVRSVEKPTPYLPGVSHIELKEIEKLIKG